MRVSHRPWTLLLLSRDRSILSLLLRNGSGSAIHDSLLSHVLGARPMSDVIVSNSAALSFGVVDRDAFILVLGFRIKRDDVPRMEKARDVPEGAEKDID